MPLVEGSSREVLASNISELIRSGRKPAQAIAIAYRKAGFSKRRKVKKRAKR